MARSASSTEIVIDSAGLSDEFQGIGALKQGGQQRGIFDYPEPQRRELMDFLFSGVDPVAGAGAAFQSLKVEIGGDGYAGEAAEPSFAHTRDELRDPRFFRGDTWWWMREARLRNPTIPIIAIPWGVPGWVGDTIPGASHAEKFFSPENIEYLVTFLRCARDADTGPDGPSLAVQYLGIWNETSFTGHERWIYELKERLRQERLDVKLVGADLGVNPDPDPLPAMYAKRAEHAAPGNLCHAFDVLGVHYPGAGGSSWSGDDPSRPVIQTRPPTPDEVAFARAVGKPLWSSEDAASGVLAFLEESTTRLLGEWYGALKLAHLLNTNYIYGRYVHTDVIFFANGMMSDVLYAPGAGLLSANRPWDGHFDIQPGLWAVAHTTQFAVPGWRYIESACGGLTQPATDCTHDATSEGSFVTLSDGVDFSVVIETMGAPGPVTKEFRIERLSTAPIHVWVSDEQEQLRREQPIDARGGRLSYTFEPNRIYTLTTTTGQGKRTVSTSERQRHFPMPYAEDFDGYEIGDGRRAAGRTIPRLITTQEGSFELVAASASGNGTACLEQKVSQPPTEWPVPWVAIHVGQRFGPPHAIFGGDNWTNYEVAADACFDRGDGVSHVSLLARFQPGASEGGDFQRRRCYELRVTEAGEVSLLKHSFVGGVLTERRLAGPLPLRRRLGRDWFRLRMRVCGYAVEGFVDDSALPIVRYLDSSQSPDDPPYLHGPAGIGTGWHTAKFDNLSVTEIAGGVTTVDEADVHFDDPTAWHVRDTPSSDLAYCNTIMSSNRASARAEVAFTGTGVVVFGMRAQNGGRARITVDGSHPAVADFFREARAIGQQVVYASPQLPRGSHVLAIEVLDAGQPGQTDHAGMGINCVHLDRVDVIA